MPKLFTVTTTATAPTEKKYTVVAETADEATAKVKLAEGETLVSTDETGGEVIV